MCRETKRRALVRSGEVKIISVDSKRKSLDESGVLQEKKDGECGFSVAIKRETSNREFFLLFLRAGQGSP